MFYLCFRVLSFKLLEKEDSILIERKSIIVNLEWEIFSKFFPSWRWRGWGTSQCDHFLKLTKITESNKIHNSFSNDLTVKIFRSKMSFHSQSWLQKPLIQRWGASKVESISSRNQDCLLASQPGFKTKVSQPELKLRETNKFLKWKSFDFPQS
jgi:hypothetical protein